jgi:hypothetical protein
MSDEERQPSDGLRTCAQCGRPFAPLVRGATYCTSMCRKKGDVERARRKREEQQA